MPALLIVELVAFALFIIALFYAPFALSGMISQQEEEAARDESHSWVREEQLAEMRKLAEREASDESPISREARKAAEELPGKAS